MGVAFPKQKNKFAKKFYELKKDKQVATGLNDGIIYICIWTRDETSMSQDWISLYSLRLGVICMTLWMHRESD